MSKKFKKETLDEFLARGGIINKLPLGEVTRQPDVIKTTAAVGPVTILSLEEADLFYGEARKGSKPKKAKPVTRIDISALPESLRIKYINRLKEEMDGEGCEEDQGSDGGSDSDDSDTSGGNED